MVKLSAEIWTTVSLDFSVPLYLFRYVIEKFNSIVTKSLNIYFVNFQEVLDDIRQTFVNCFTYNKPEAEEFQCGVRLEKFFLKETKKLGFVDENEEPQSASFENNAQPPAKKSRRTF